MNELRKVPPTKKIKVPAGDGSWKEVEAQTHPGQSQDSDKAAAAMQKAQEKDFFKRVGQCTEELNKFLRVMARDKGLEPEEVIAAVYLENCNNRFYYPEEKGGKKRFDQITSEVWDWFKENVTT